ncbi:hypothetical protein [Nodosilinea nodulosa]|uniref:hypothetical protein n=1 Tax=Nodosilinea nodulosa TaxID=416001 RepID=UPI0012D8166F|nr:hypothetical protein [Nodosilinea nodulosa]
MTREPIEMVMVANELVHGPIPPISLDKLRDPQGPLKYAFIQKQIEAKASEQQFIQVLVDTAYKNRGIIYGFVTPWTYEALTEEGKAAISPSMLTTTNFHNVSLTRANGGFAKFLIDLQTAGLAPWEVITRIGIDASHKGPGGDELAGVFFDYRLPETKAEKDFLKRVADTIEAHGDADIPRPRTLASCIAYESVEQFLVSREEMPRFMGTMLVHQLIAGTEWEEAVDIRQLQFSAASEFSALPASDIEAMAQQLIGPIDVAPIAPVIPVDDDGTIEVQATAA